MVVVVVVFSVVMEIWELDGQEFWKKRISTTTRNTTIFFNFE